MVEEPEEVPLKSAALVAEAPLRQMVAEAPRITRLALQAPQEDHHLVLALEEPEVLPMVPQEQMEVVWKTAVVVVVVQVPVLRAIEAVRAVHQEGELVLAPRPVAMLHKLALAVTGK